MMTDRWCAVGLVTLLGCASCGGKADSDAIQPSGFYERSVETITDSCSLPATTRTKLELVGTTPEVVNVALPGTMLRQDFGWRGEQTVPFQKCESSIRFSIISTATDSFSADVDLDWKSPGTCLGKD